MHPRHLSDGGGRRFLVEAWKIDPNVLQDLADLASEIPGELGEALF